MSNGNYKWKNRANKQWTLIPNQQECNVVDLDTKNPYYSSGYTSTSFTETGIYGPSNELYEYLGVSRLFHLFVMRPFDFT